MSKLNGLDLSVLPVTYQATIPEDYLDVMGHMNVAWYLHLFMRATGGVFNLIGLNTAYMKSQHAGTFALESHVKYLSEVRVDHHVTLRSRFIDRSAKRLQLLHFMQNDDKQDVAATYEVISAHIDMDVRRMAPYPDFISEKFDEVLAEHRALDWAPPVCGSMKP